MTYCPECTGLLDPDSTEIRERLIEGVLAAAAEVVCHLVPYRYCPSCQKHFGPAVLEAMPRDHISLYTYVLTAWLHYRTGLSMKSSVELLRHSGLEITKGGLAQGWQRLAGHLRPAYDQILEKVKSSLVLMADETGWRIRGVTYWLWYFGTRLWSYYIIDRRRGTGVVNKVLGEIIEGILITDFWGAYNAIDAWAKQRCLFHLFTELRKVDLRNNSPPWRSFRRRLYRIFRDAIRLVGNQDIDQPTFQRRKARIDTRLDNLLDEPTQDKDAQRLIKRLRRHRNEMLTFLDFAPIVSPYNNHSEQEMRGPVICRRISQGNRSLAGAQTQAILMSLFRSAELQGWDPVQYVLKLVQDSIAGCPSVLPPAPDAAEQIADVA